MGVQAGGVYSFCGGPGCRAGSCLSCRGPAYWRGGRVATRPYGGERKAGAAGGGVSGFRPLLPQRGLRGNDGGIMEWGGGGRAPSRPRSYFDFPQHERLNHLVGERTGLMGAAERVRGKLYAYEASCTVTILHFAGLGVLRAGNEVLPLYQPLNGTPLISPPPGSGRSVVTHGRLSCCISLHRRFLGTGIRVLAVHPNRRGHHWLHHCGLCCGHRVRAPAEGASGWR